MIKKFALLPIILVLFILICTGCSGINNKPTDSPNIKPEKPVINKDNENFDKVEIGEVTPDENTDIIEEPEPEPEPELIMYFTEKDVIALAKVLYNECRDVPSTVEKACVGWTACNRVDAGFGDTIYEVLTAPKQFAYKRSTPVTDELYNLALDVLIRWNNEKNGFEDVGRALPPEYMWFRGDGKHNYFRDKFDGNFNIWNYSLNNPYDS